MDQGPTLNKFKTLRPNASFQTSTLRALCLSAYHLLIVQSNVSNHREASNFHPLAITSGSFPFLCLLRRWRLRVRLQLTFGAFCAHPGRNGIFFRVHFYIFRNLSLYLITCFRMRMRVTSQSQRMWLYVSAVLNCVSVWHMLA
jgi:hypothetical protein